MAGNEGVDRGQVKRRAFGLCEPCSQDNGSIERAVGGQMGSNSKALRYFVYFGSIGGPGQVLDQHFAPFEDADLFGER